MTNRLLLKAFQIADCLKTSLGQKYMYRLYAIHHVTKHEVESGWKSGYYAAILGGKEDRGLWSANTTKHFASSLCRVMQVSLFASVSGRSC